MLTFGLGLFTLGCVAEAASWIYIFVNMFMGVKSFLDGDDNGFKSMFVRHMGAMVAIVVSGVVTFAGQVVMIVGGLMQAGAM